jgi:TonB family protein
VQAVSFRSGQRAFSALALVLAFAFPARAQSVAIDDQAPPPAASVTPPPATPKLIATPIVPPRAVSTPIAYPSGQQGDHEVVLELTISKQGVVSAATAISGDALFAASAIDATRTWTFEPATRGGAAIAAKIRFAVHFEPPSEAPEASPSAPPSANPTPVAVPSKPQQMREILVIGKREPLRHTLGHADVHDMPGAFGDPYRAIEALPGVVPIVSGLPYFYVRGAPPGNVGYFFDGIPVPYLYHFAAGPGVLQPAFVDHVDLYPGAYPARYGRFAGAIVAGEMAPPSYRFHGEASIRLIDSGATIEAPFANGRGSAMVGGRFSYTAAVLSLIVPDVSLNYWDYQGRARYELDSNNSVEVLSFGAGDFLSDTETDTNVTNAPSPSNPSGLEQVSTSQHQNTVVDVNFHRLDLRWDRRIHGGNWRNAVMLGLDRTGGSNGDVNVTNHMVGARSEYQQTLSDEVTLRAGADVLFESLAQKVSNQNSGSTSDGQIIGDSNNDDNAGFVFDAARRDLTTGAWVDSVLSLTPKLEVTPGLRADLYVSGGRVALSFDPRISARFSLSKKLSVTHGLALVHQAPSFVVPVPGFKPSLAGGLQSAVQYSAGLNYSLPEGFESSLAVFQNAFFNMTDLISLIQLQNTTSQSATDVRSTGHAYGVELMVRRSLARNVGGFVSYTLSRSVRSEGNLEGPATTDRTHVLNVALSGNLGKNWRLGGRWLFYSGIPTRVAYVQAAEAPPRTPPFWRLDFKLQKRWYIKAPTAWWGVALEVLNTTLNKEALVGDCNAFTCTYQKIGPVTVPSIGAEGAF